MQQLTKVRSWLLQVPLPSASLSCSSHAVIDYYDNIETRRVVSNVSPGYLHQLLPSGPPDNGEPWSEIQKDIESKIMPGLTHW